jgi:hypothetical protein
MTRATSKVLVDFSLTTKYSLLPPNFRGPSLAQEAKVLEYASLTTKPSSSLLNLDAADLGLHCRCVSAEQYLTSQPYIKLRCSGHAKSSALGDGRSYAVAIRCHCSCFFCSPWAQVQQHEGAGRGTAGIALACFVLLAPNVNASMSYQSVLNRGTQFVQSASK